MDIQDELLIETCSVITQTKLIVLKERFGINGKIDIPISVSYRELIKALNTLESSLKKTDNANISAFIFKNKSLVKNAFDDLKIITNEPNVISLRDKIFKNILQLHKPMPSDITLIFTNLIKGITYFKEQKTTKIPVYHRLNACGSGDNAFREEWNRCHNANKAVHQAVRNKIETCYIERLIYDELYKNQSFYFPAKLNNLPTQNEGHIKRLALTKEDFQTCFPENDIIVELIYSGNTRLPTRVIIKRVERETPFCIEVYDKSINIENNKYNKVVECSKSLADELFFKGQTFAQETAWEKI
jgi:hypothetical protein